MRGKAVRNGSMVQGSGFKGSAVPSFKAFTITLNTEPGSLDITLNGEP
jgi:hypothetical protein